MRSKSRNHRRPDFLVVLTLFVSFGMLATALAQAAEPLNITSDGEARTEQSDTTDWWSIDLAGKLQSWKPRVHVDEGGKGLRLAQPFGARGPALRVQKTAPGAASNLMRNSNGGMLGGYLFLEKRW